MIESDLGKTYGCYQCEAKFKKRAKFANHFYRFHKEKTLKCENCKKLFAHSTFLRIHLKRCKGESLSKYNTNENISYKKILVGDRMENIQCMICEEVFDSISSFHESFSVESNSFVEIVFSTSTFDAMKCSSFNSLSGSLSFEPEQCSK